jgi:hypothetical protein
MTTLMSPLIIIILIIIIIIILIETNFVSTKMSTFRCLDDALDEEAFSLLVDREACLGVLGASHEAHLGVILQLEDTAKAREIKLDQGECAKCVGCGISLIISVFIITVYTIHLS